MKEGRAVSNLHGDKEWRIELPESEIELRDFFAAQAIHCFTLNDVEVTKLLSGEYPRHDLVARFCYGLADAMMAQRNKRADAATATTTKE